MLRCASMSVALVTNGARDGRSRLVPVATEAVFVARWLPGIVALGLAWGELMQTGIDIVPENRHAVIDELGRLRHWMVASHGTGAYEIVRLDLLLEGLAAIDFAAGETAFLG